MKRLNIHQFILISGLCLGYAIGCGTDSVVWECECESTYEDDEAYYDDEISIELCDTEEEIDQAIEEALAECAEDLEADDFYNIECSCECETDGEAC